MRYLLDTSFISEVRKGARANRGVRAWEMANDVALCAISVVTIAEIRMGIEECRPTDLNLALALEEWLDVQITLFADHILPVTLAIADRWGRIMAGTNLPERDTFLAATALEHDLTIVTRNVSDFRRSGARLLNPWK
jgi:toxin FitB